MKEKVLITAALPYANGPLHFGHIAGAYLPADCYARFKRLMGCDVLYICGSDEYGVAITISAEKEKRSPKEHVDLYHEINKAFFKELNISFDHYSRTTWEGHKAVTQRFFLDLLKNGYIEEKITDQLFSSQENRFLADRYVEGTCPKCSFAHARGDECPKCGASYEATDLISPRSKITGSSLILKPTKHWFLRFDLFKEKLKNWITDKKWKANVFQFAMRYIDELKARAITRDGNWGVPLPLDNTEGKVLYVWFDAPIGYISATKEWAETTGSPDAWAKYWEDPNVKLVQFIGKDNIPFHAVFFPAMIMGQNEPYKLVDELPANEFYNLEGRQFSKSEGWTIDLENFFKHFTSDQIRYAIAANAPETQDSEFTWKDFESRCNAELLGKYGNLVNRVLVFAEQSCGYKMPQTGTLDEKDLAFQETQNRICKEIADAYEHFHLRKACQLIMELSQASNGYFDAKKPWHLAKDPQNSEALNTTIALCIEALKRLAVISDPVIPQSAEKVGKMLGFQHPLKSWDAINHPIPTGQVFGTREILFQKVDDALIEQEVLKLEALKAKASKPKVGVQMQKPLIDIEEFDKVDLRVARIESVERVPKSKKLLKFIMDVGGEKRTILSGIGEKMTSLDHLLGKDVIIVSNLKPVTIMGIESQGMLLSGQGLEGFELPSVNCTSGSVIR